MARLEVGGLHVEFFTDEGIVRAVDGVDVTVEAGVRLGLVGESGSGKTTTALALMGMIEPPGQVTAGTAHLDDLDLLALDETQQERVRLSQISYIPQGAMNSLNPVMRVADQLVDGMIDHGLALGRRERRARAAALLERVGLSADVARMYPHELSGGMKQRVCIAIAISLEPRLIIADEPTSALDVVTQRQVMETLRKVQEEIGASLILIGHDMGLMAQFVDQLMVMRHGKVVEHGDTLTLFTGARHDYTRTLIASVPSIESRQVFQGASPASSRPGRNTDDQPLLELRSVTKTYERGLFRRSGTRALHPLTLRLDGRPPLVVSVVGQSGSGKTTLGSLVLGFLQPSDGEIRFEGRRLGSHRGDEQTRFRKNVQAVFQDPYAAYNPFYKVDHALVQPLRNFGLAAGRDASYERMVGACRAVGLEPEHTIFRFAHQLSGGQRQRLMVGRAIMLAPRLLVADEPVSMVDASLRLSILNNLRAMREEQGTSIIYITHDLATAYQISDYVLVLHRGRVVEAGDPEVVIKDPEHPYTRLLVDSIPWPDPKRHWGSEEAITDELRQLTAQADAGPTLVRSEIEGLRLGG
jgi:peptide/nickel transport system ATP-binding protein